MTWFVARRPGRGRGAEAPAREKARCTQRNSIRHQNSSNTTEMGPVAVRKFPDSIFLFNSSGLRIAMKRCIFVTSGH